MKRESWWGRQLQREDLITTLEQGRRVEVELFQEKHRGLRTMGELLKARMFGATEWAINLRKRMTNYVQGDGSSSSSFANVPSVGRPPEPQGLFRSDRNGFGPESPGYYEPHSWPCDDPWCPVCEPATKRLLRDVGVLPRKGAKR